jgi:hypothetical protein
LEKNRHPCGGSVALAPRFTVSGGPEAFQVAGFRQDRTRGSILSSLLAGTLEVMTSNVTCQRMQIDRVKIDLPRVDPAGSNIATHPQSTNGGLSRTEKLNSAKLGR